MKYRILTYDIEKEEYTPEEGMQRLTAAGLKKAMRKLEGRGYDGGKDDPSIVVEEIEETKRGLFP